MSVSEPGKIITPWAESGLKNPIPPSANPATGRAGFDQGFSAINMTAKEAGGIPPFGQDFNGIFYEVTNILRYMQAGGQPTFDAALATAIGGYPKGAMVLGGDGFTLWQSKVDSNSTDPNTDPSDWGTFDIGLKADLAAPDGSDIVGFQQSGVGAIPRTSQDKMREIVSAPDFGVGVAAFNAAKVEMGTNPVLIPRGTFDIGAAEPDYEVKGPGEVAANGVTSGGADLSYNPARESVFFTPTTYQREKQGINYPAPRGIDYVGSSYNFVLSIGSKLQDQAKSISNNVVVGTLCGSAPIDWSRNTVLGPSVMAYAGRVERTTAVGSENLAWFGAPNQQWLRTYEHDWWRSPLGNPVVPGDPGWSGGLEEIFPGIGARINAFTGYATNSEEAGFTSVYGRNAGGHLVAGIRNVFSGYSCAGQMFSGSYNCGYGARSLFNVVFGENLTAMGDSSGRDALDSNNACFFGYGAGRTVQNASGGVFIGNRTADGVISAEGAVIIGNQAGAAHTSNLDNKLIISNAPATSSAPIICGDFTTNRVGISMTPELLRARFHIKSAGSGSALIPDAGLLVEGTNVSAITIETNSSGFGNLSFADQDSINVGAIVYGHGSNSLTFKTNGLEKWRIESAGHMRPMLDNAYSVGTGALRASTIYAGTGAINTSDERAKTFLDIDAAETAVAKALKDMIRKFKFNDAIEAKGIDGARIHFGVGAQSVGEVFTAHGLDPHNYAMFCYDEWGDEFEDHAAEYEEIPAVTEEVEGAVIEIAPATKRLVKEAYTVQAQVAGNRYGIRYDELLTFIISAM